jgi:hypothetical protein
VLTERFLPRMMKEETTIDEDNLKIPVDVGGTGS